MSFTDPFSLDREVRVGAERWRRWRRALRRGAVSERPFGDSTRFGKTLFDEVRELPDGFPVRAGLVRWVVRLAEQRIDAPWLAREASLLRAERHPVREPVEGRFTLQEITRAALVGKDAAAWHRARIRALPALAAHRKQLWQRRQEIAERLGLASPDELELPHPALYGEAEAWLAATDDPVRQFVDRGMAAFVESALARPAGDGWPARMGADTFVDLLGQRDWFRSVALEPGPLPARLAPMSFPRALARVGAAWHVALAPSDQPFVLAQDPYGPWVWRSGALWALLACQPAFLRRQLGLAPHRAVEHERCLALGVLQSTRLLAVRCLTRSAALRGGATFTDRAGALLFRWLGEELEPDLLLGLTRLRIDDAQRLAGWFLAARRLRELVERYDEDWFRSPRAVEELREEARLLRSTPADGDALAAGRQELCAWAVERAFR
jgi:hypothetical protein